MTHSRLRFAEHVLPAPHPIRSWTAFWDFVDSQRAPAGEPRVPRPTGHNPTVKAYARVDEGRWIVDCPWGCGAAFNLPQGASTMWCTECAGAGWGHSASLVWPADMARTTANIESLPVIFQSWPCASCHPRLVAGQSLCEACRRLQGLVT